MNLRRKIVLISLLLAGPLALSAQKLDSTRILRHLQLRWDTVLSRQDVVILMDTTYMRNLDGIRIDQNEYAVPAGWQKIMAIDSNDVMIIRPQVMHDRRSGTYNRLIVISTKSGQTKKNIKSLYDMVISGASFKTPYDYRRSDTMTLTKNRSLVINDTIVRNNKEMSSFYSIPFEDIVNIDFTGPYGKPFYGPNSKNGVVLIWTKQKNR